MSLAFMVVVVVIVVVVPVRAMQLCARLSSRCLSCQLAVSQIRPGWPVVVAVLPSFLLQTRSRRQERSRASLRVEHLLQQRVGHLVRCHRRRSAVALR